MESENKYKEGELLDEELDNVAGGAEGCKPANTYEKIFYKTQGEVQFIFNVGDHVEALATGCKHHTATCKVVNRQITAVFDDSDPSGPVSVREFLGYVDEYWLEKCSGVSSAFVKGWYTRDRIEK